MPLTVAEKVDPSRAALIVVDVQNAYCHPEGMSALRGLDVSTCPAAVANIQRLIEGARRIGVPVIYVRNAHEACTESEAWAAMRSGPPTDRGGFAGTWGAEFYEIRPAPGEPIVNKHRYSGFVGTRLDNILRTYRRSSLIMTGVATNVCVESTARDGAFLDYHVVFMADATAANDGPAAHEATLENMRRHFGVVVSTDELLQLWAHLPPAQAPEPISPPVAEIEMATHY
jgi:ureidoacrylate peracid hydrolase